MTGYGWPNVPADVREQLESLVSGIEDVLGHKLIGIYLHGSLVLGCYNPQRSDIDLIAVTRGTTTEDERRRLAPVLLQHSGPKAWPRTPPYPYEISFLRQDQLRPWRHPSPFDFHFEEEARERFERGDYEPRAKTHPDLASAVPLLHAAGIVLAGRPIAEVFPVVPKVDFVDLLHREIAWCREKAVPFYAVLTVSRAWATLAEGGLPSKRSGAAWALEHAPEEFRPLIAQALALYAGEIDQVDLDRDAVDRYVDFVSGEVGTIASR